jgi:hypothetical protein
MRKIKKTKEVTPPLPLDKPASYDNKTTKATHTVGNRETVHQPTRDMDNANPQKTREKMEMDTTKRERDPGMTRK